MGLTFTTTPYDPFTELRRFRDDLDRAFGTQPFARAAFPPVNVWTGEDGVAVAAELPGMAAEDVELTVKEDLLTISGERRAPEPDGETRRRERAYGKFTRTVQLPFKVDADKVEARFEHGVLAIELQRPEADRPRRIAISA